MLTQSMLFKLKAQKMAQACLKLVCLQKVTLVDEERFSGLKMADCSLPRLGRDERKQFQRDASLSVLSY